MASTKDELEDLKVLASRGQFRELAIEAELKAIVLDAHGNSGTAGRALFYAGFARGELGA